MWLPCQKTTAWTLILAFAVAAIVVGALFPTIIDKVINSTISQGLILDQKTMSASAWDEFVREDKRSYKVYLFNLTNLEEAASNTNVKLNVQECGPYTYKKISHRYNISWNSDRSLIDYEEYSEFQFINSSNLNDKITTINMPFLFSIASTGPIVAGVGYAKEKAFEIAISSQAFSAFNSSLVSDGELNHVLRGLSIPYYLGAVETGLQMQGLSSAMIIQQWQSKAINPAGIPDIGHFELLDGNSVTLEMAQVFWNKSETMSFFHPQGASVWFSVFSNVTSTIDTELKPYLKAAFNTSDSGKVVEDIQNWMYVLTGVASGVGDATEFRTYASLGIENSDAGQALGLNTTAAISQLSSWDEWGWYQFGTGNLILAMSGGLTNNFHSLLGEASPLATAFELPVYNIANNNIAQIKNFLNTLGSDESIENVVAQYQGIGTDISDACTNCGITDDNVDAYTLYVRIIGQKFGISGELIGAQNKVIGPGNQGMFTTRTAQELLFGYTDAIWQSIGMKWDGFIGPSYNNSNIHYASTRAGKNITAYSKYTGYDNIDINNRLYRYDGYQLLSNVQQIGNPCNHLTTFRYDCKIWDEAENINMLYDGSGIPPFQEGKTASDMVKVWVDEVKRGVSFINSGQTINYKGIELQQYLPHYAELQRTPKNRVNYGMDDEWTTSDYVVPLSYVYGADIGSSFPHFYKANSSVYSHYLTGINPQQSLHASELDVEPLTGKTMRAFKRLQAYAHFTSSRYNSELSPWSTLLGKDAAQPLYIPMYWISEEAVISDSDASDFVDSIYGNRETANVVLGVLVGLGSAIFILSAAMLAKTIISPDFTSETSTSIN